METLYIKLYEKYSKLKGSKDAEIDQINQNQEIKFLDFVSAAESLIEHLTAENKSLCRNLDDLQMEVVSLRTAKEQHFDDLQELWKEQKKKNQQLSAEIEQLRNLQHEGLFNSNRSDRHEDQHVNNVQHSPSGSGHQMSESPMRMTRNRAKLLTATNAENSPSTPRHVELSKGKGISLDHSRRDALKILAPPPECCRSIIDGGDPCKCVFQGLFECLIGMTVSVVNQPEGKCIHAIHQSSGYSFSLKCLDNASQGEGQLLYNVSSLGTFAKVAPEWMREAIIFSMSMCPIFFERISRVIRQC